MITDQGKNIIVGAMSDVLNYAALGSDNTVNSGSEVSLGSEYGRTRRPFDSVNVLQNSVEFTMILPSTEPSGLQPCTFRELGVFTGSPTGSMFSRSTFYNVDKNDNLEYQTIMQVRVE